MFMGRVVDAASWDPEREPGVTTSRIYTGPERTPLYLTSIGFTGAAFSGYYPDCRSVFGFWDTFADVERRLPRRSTANNAIKFRVSYTVIGWLPDAPNDPLSGLRRGVISHEVQPVRRPVPRTEQVKVTSTPADVFQRHRQRTLYGWQFSAERDLLHAGRRTRCWPAWTCRTATSVPGVIQEVVWKVEQPSADTPFLLAPTTRADLDRPGGDRHRQHHVEAVSALVKRPAAGAPAAAKRVLASYETLLNALQLGLLRDLEARATTLVTLEEALHAIAFSQVDGGHQWTVQTGGDS